MDVSVCIATCRRPEGLARLLESLARQKLPPSVEMEILVVDDEPGSSVAPPALPHPVRCVALGGRNIAGARNRAVAEARGRWLAFVDDDEWVAEDWVARYLAAAEATEADGWFGPVLPVLERVVTPWLDVERFYGRPRHATGDTVPRAELRTSNAFVRRALFEGPQGRQGRRFDPAFGRSGGSDSELFGRMVAEGARMLWCDDAVVTEVVPSERHTLRWLSRRAFRGGVVSTRIAPGGAPRALAGLALFACALPFALLFGRARAARIWLRLCVQAGHLWSASGRSFEEYA